MTYYLVVIDFVLFFILVIVESNFSNLLIKISACFAHISNLACTTEPTSHNFCSHSRQYFSFYFSCDQSATDPQHIKSISNLYISTFYTHNVKNVSSCDSPLKLYNCYLNPLSLIVFLNNFVKSSSFA